MTALRSGQIDVEPGEPVRFELINTFPDATGELLAGCREPGPTTAA